MQKARGAMTITTWCWCVSKWIMRLLRSQVYLTCNSHSSFSWQHTGEEGNRREVYELFHQTKGNSRDRSNYKPQLSQVTCLKIAATSSPYGSSSWRKVMSVKTWKLPSMWCALLLVHDLHTAASRNETSSSHKPETLLQTLYSKQRGWGHP